MTEAEIWRDIPGWEGCYRASNMGRISSVERVRHQRTRHGTVVEFKRPAKVLSPGRNEKGYLVVVLCDMTRGRLPKTHRAHRLICEAFHGPCPDGHEAAHRDGTRDNNQAGNLRWLTHIENVREIPVHKRSKGRRRASGGV